LWRFAKEDNTLWKNVVELKYGIDGLGWWSKKSKHPHGVGCWKSIISGLDQFKSLMNFEVNNGREFIFGMMCGVEIVLSKFIFRNSSGWHVVKMPRCNKWCLGGINIIGTLVSPEALMIRKKRKC